MNQSPIPDTYVEGRPWTLLPLPKPSDWNPAEEFGEDFFYNAVAKPLIRDTVKLMTNGLPIDLAKVKGLEDTVDQVLANVTKVIDNNEVINDFYKWKYPKLLKEHIAEYDAKIHTIEDHIRPFKASDIEHRSYFVHCYIADNVETTFDLIPPLALTVMGLPKWTINDIKRIVQQHPKLECLVTKSVPETNKYAKRAMVLLAQHKADKFNERHDYIAKKNKQDIKDIVPTFNPGSSNQLHDLLTNMLGYESDQFTDAFKDWQREVQRNAQYGTPIESEMPKNKYSWPRDEIEKLKYTVDDGTELDKLLQAFIDHSFAAIIKQNFIESFYKYTVNGRLHGSYKLLGAKSGRYTSSNPNMLNAPSTGSIYAKPLKKCFTAPPGFVIAAIDYSALEDRVIASLTNDTNKCAVFTEGVDGHSLGACAYFPKEVAEHMPLTGDSVADAKEFKRLVDEGNKELKAIRQRGKGVTFGLSYGAYPPKVAQSIKCDLSVAEQIFDNYHHKLYPGITQYREEYVLPTVEEHKEIHLGLGFSIKSDKPGKDIRTLNNATAQFWSILTAIAINEIHHRIDEAGYQDDIIITSTIYDSIYMIVREDPTIIQWLNENLIEVMEQDFLTDQIVHNEARLELGPDWSDLTEIPEHATISEIEEVLTKLKGTE